MGFAKRALNAGHSETDIIDEIGRKTGIDVNALRRNGRGESDVLAALVSQQIPARNTPEPRARLSIPGTNLKPDVTHLVPVGSAMSDVYQGTRQLLGMDNTAPQNVEVGHAIEQQYPYSRGAAKVGIGSAMAVPVMAAAPGAFAAGASIPARYAGAAGIGALQGATTPLEDGGAMARAKETGANAALAMVGQGAGELAGKAISPAIGSASDAQLLENLKRAARIGYKPTPGQVAGSKSAQQVEASASSFPPSSGPFFKRDAENQKAMNRAVASSFGEKAEKLDEEVISRAFNRLGPIFEKAKTRPEIPLAPSFAQRIGQIKDEFAGPWESLQDSTLNKTVDDALAAANAGSLSAKGYQQVVSRLGSVIRKMAGSKESDKGAMQGLIAIKDALDDAAAATMTVKDRTHFNMARKQYASLMTALNSKAINVATGDVQPRILANSLANKDLKGYATGNMQGPLYDVAKVGKAFPPIVGDSGTATRMSGPAMLMGIGGAGGIGAGLGHGPEALAGAAGLMAGSNLAARAYMSPAMQRYLANTLAPEQLKQFMALQGAAQAGAQ